MYTVTIVDLSGPTNAALRVDKFLGPVLMFHVSLKLDIACPILACVSYKLTLYWYAVTMQLYALLSRSLYFNWLVMYF
jgi:hypothetical protein